MMLATFLLLIEVHAATSSPTLTTPTTTTSWEPFDHRDDDGATHTRVMTVEEVEEVEELHDRTIRGIAYTSSSSSSSSASSSASSSLSSAAAARSPPAPLSYPLSFPSGDDGPPGHAITTGQPLVSMTEVDGNDVTLVFDQVKVTFNGVSWYTRGYNGGMLGPLIHTHAGATMNILLHNRLGEEPPYNPLFHNTFQTLNTTNVHTHGLHVSSKAPADDIFIEVLPGEDYHYHHHIPSYHMGGTHWYHPHHHGSTANQAGGGANGMLIVDDLKTEVPPEIAGLKTVFVMIQQIDVQDLVKIERKGGGDLWQTTLDHTLLLVNGHEMPVIGMEVGVWYRWRTVYASVNYKLKMMMSDERCEMRLIAKDGIYLMHAPRVTTSIPYTLGGRVDVLVMCSVEGTFTLQSGGGRGVFEGDFATLSVVDTGKSSPEPPSFVVQRPCYLADLTCAKREDMDTHWSIYLGRFHINHQPFVNKSTSLDDSDFTVGSVVEWSVKGSGRHPFHVHVNPFQISEVQSSDPVFHQVGDWHDVVGGPSSLTVRSQLTGFTGKAMMHCHKLSDEDRGMMGYININGVEGATSPLAHHYDPGCHLDSTRGYTYSDTAPQCGVGTKGAFIHHNHHHTHNYDDPDTMAHNNDNDNNDHDNHANQQQQQQTQNIKVKVMKSTQAARIRSKH